MDFKFDENTLWILGILALVFFLFPQNNKKVEEEIQEEIKEERIEEKVEKDYIYRRKCRVRRRLVY